MSRIFLLFLVYNIGGSSPNMAYKIHLCGSHFVAHILFHPMTTIISKNLLKSRGIPNCIKLACFVLVFAPQVNGHRLVASTVLYGNPLPTQIEIFFLFGNAFSRRHSSMKTKLVKSVVPKLSKHCSVVFKQQLAKVPSFWLQWA